MSKKVVGQLAFSVYVECPLCTRCLDLNDAPYSDYEQYKELTMAIFNNKWENIDLEVECNHCKNIFILNNIEY